MILDWVSPFKWSVVIMICILELLHLEIQNRFDDFLNQCQSSQQMFLFEWQIKRLETAIDANSTPRDNPLSADRDNSSFNPQSAEYFLYNPWRPKAFIQFEIIINESQLFRIHLHTYVMGLRPLQIISSHSVGIDFRRQNQHL